MPTFTFSRDAIGEPSLSGVSLATCERRLAGIGISARVHPEVQQAAWRRQIELTREVMAAERLSFVEAATVVHKRYPVLGTLSRADVLSGGSSFDIDVEPAR